MKDGPLTKKEIIEILDGRITLKEGQYLKERLFRYGISDGYHSFDELYDHRCLLYIRLCLATARKTVWAHHKDFGEWSTCLFLETPNGQISYHIPDKFKHLFVKKIKRDDNYNWDGHSSFDVIDRLLK